MIDKPLKYRYNKYMEKIVNKKAAIWHNKEGREEG